MEQKIFKEMIDVYMQNYNLTESMDKESIKGWWKQTKHLDNDTFSRCMHYQMEKNIRPFGFMAVIRLAKSWQRDHKYKILEAEMKSMTPRCQYPKKGHEIQAVC